jgi:hypothetical protein
VVPMKLETTTFRIELGTPVSSPPILSMLTPPLGFSCRHHSVKPRSLRPRAAEPALPL